MIKNKQMLKIYKKIYNLMNKKIFCQKKYKF